MSVQAIGSSTGNQYTSALTNDFKSLQDDLTTLESAQSSGNQDQITLSQDALKKAMDQFQSDLTSLTQGTQGHHHHHHHKVDNSSSASSGNTDTTVASPSDATASQYSAQPQINVFNINLKA